MSTAVHPSPSNQQQFLQKRQKNPDWRLFYANGVPTNDEVIVISDDEDNNYRIGSGAPQIIDPPLTNQHHHNDSSSSTSSSLSITTAMTSTTNSSNENSNLNSNSHPNSLKYSNSKIPIDNSKRLRKYSSSGTFEQIVDIDQDYYEEHDEYNAYDDSPYCTESTDMPIGTARSSLTRTSSSIASNGIVSGLSVGELTTGLITKKRKRVSRRAKYDDNGNSKYINNGNIGNTGNTNHYTDQSYFNHTHSQYHSQYHDHSNSSYQSDHLLNQSKYTNHTHSNYPRLLLTPPDPMVKPSDVEVPPVIDKVRNLDVCDDKDGHFVVKLNTHFADNRYQILKLLGQGTFGKVVAVYDKKLKTHRAIKIIRAVEKYREASRIELRVLMTLAMYDQENVHQCIHLRDCFDYKNHICIVTDLLGISIFDFMKANNFLPFPGSHIQSFAYQLLRSVSFLHSLNLVHTDLKPENILLTNSESKSMNYRKGRSAKKRNILQSTQINLIDFGSAIFNDEHHSSVVSTRHYRAPEIILGIGWSFPCDIWSIGCILVELCTGEALFQTHDNLEHLALMEKVIGQKLDANVIQRIPTRSPVRNDFINKYTNNINYPNSDVDPASIKYVNSVKTFDQLIQSSVSYYTRDKAFWSSFLDLLRKIFVYDANKRITAREALDHPWFKKSINDDGIESHLQHKDEYQPSTRSYTRSKQRL